MKCNLCRLLPNGHPFKVCRWSTCDCACFVEYLKKRNGKIDLMKGNSPEWLVMGIKELKEVKIPKEYAEYMTALWNTSRGIEFRKDYTPIYWRSLKPKNKVFNWLKIVGLRQGKNRKHTTWFKQIIEI